MNETNHLRASEMGDANHIQSLEGFVRIDVNFLAGVRPRCARLGTDDGQPISTARLSRGLSTRPEWLLDEPMPESPDSLRSCPSSTSRTSSASRKAFIPRLRTELVLTLVLLIARRCIDARPVLIVWRERSSSVQSLYNSSRSRYRASSRNSRRASRRDDEDDNNCAARGKLAGCSGVDGGSRRYDRMCAYLQVCQI